LKADREINGPAARRSIVARKLSANTEHEAFLQLENSIEDATIALLSKY
jgi:hypothetical protein